MSDPANEQDERQVNQFAKDVYALVAQIPSGRVMSYGQIAALCGSPRSARTVGQIAHWGPPDLPWQRVVNRQGGSRWWLYHRWSRGSSA